LPFMFSGKFFNSQFTAGDFFRLRVKFQIASNK
jgi:hypothetical protein